MPKSKNHYTLTAQVRRHKNGAHYWTVKIDGVPMATGWKPERQQAIDRINEIAKERVKWAYYRRHYHTHLDEIIAGWRNKYGAPPPVKRATVRHLIERKGVK